MLFDELENYAASDFYPFHMPGHKRKMNDYRLKEAFNLDITEIEGFDNLHHPDGMIKEMQEKAANLYQSDQSYFLVNGSSCGILSAICASTRKGGTILVARNSHKSVFYGAFLNELHLEYIYPQYIPQYDVNGGLNPDEIECALIKNSNIQAVLITSPSYDGVVSDIKKIAEIVHKYGIPLLVDEAHGAHFGFDDYFPQRAIRKGADIVINSVHKTLPSLTQTALLHIKGNLVNRTLVEKYLSIYQSSSPSYLLMGSIDQCLDIILNEGKELFDKYTYKLNEFYRSVKKLKHFHVLTKEIIGSNSVYDWDRSKIIISCKESSISAKELYYKLLNIYHLQMEMVSGTYVLGMTSIMDSQDGFTRLARALREIDSSIGKEKLIYNKNINKDSNINVNKNINANTDTNINTNVDANINTNINANTDKRSEDSVGLKEIGVQNILKRAEVNFTITEAFFHKKETLCIEQSTGRVSGEYIYLYPPGIPILVPGEVITKEMIEKVNLYKKAGLEIQGLDDYTIQTIKVLL